MNHAIREAIEAGDAACSCMCHGDHHQEGTLCHICRETHAAIRNLARVVLEEAERHALHLVLPSGKAENDYERGRLHASLDVRALLPAEPTP